MHYIHRFHVQAPLERVAEFHRDSRALRWLTPPPIFVQFHMIQPLSEGSVSEFTMWLGPIPIHWVAVHSNVTTLHGFTDTQTSGPFESWIHKHQFRPVGELSTEIIDEVDAEFGKSGWLGLVSRFMWFNLSVLFAFRAWRTRRILERS